MGNWCQIYGEMKQNVLRNYLNGNVNTSLGRRWYSTDTTSTCFMFWKCESVQKCPKVHKCFQTVNMISAWIWKWSSLIYFRYFPFLWSLSICCLRPFLLLKWEHSISRVLSTLVHPQTFFCPAKFHYDIYSYALVMQALTCKFCHICCKDGRRQLCGLLQCDLAYFWTPLAFHTCCRKPVYGHHLFECQLLSSLILSAHQVHVVLYWLNCFQGQQWC